MPVFIKEDNIDYVIVWDFQYDLRCMVIFSHLLDPLCYSFNTNRDRTRYSSGDFANQYLWCRYFCTCLGRGLLTCIFQMSSPWSYLSFWIACTWKFPVPWCEVSFKEVRHHVITFLSTCNQYFMVYIGVLIEPINFLIHRCYVDISTKYTYAYVVCGGYGINYYLLHDDIK